jgi:hypothetical protein
MVDFVEHGAPGFYLGVRGRWYGMTYQISGQVTLIAAILHPVHNRKCGVNVKLPIVQLVSRR